MSQYTSLGVTVSPVAADGFLEMIGRLAYGEPDQLARSDDGAVTAVWQDRNHFDQYSSDEYRAIMAFLNGIPSELYAYESITEDYEPETGGDYQFDFERVVVYHLYGKPIRLGKTVSKSRKFGRRRDADRHGLLPSREKDGSHVHRRHGDKGVDGIQFG